MSDVNGAELIADYLVRARVPYVVTLCGHGNLGMLDALAARQDEITTISVHHEAAAGFKIGRASCRERVLMPV